MTSEMTPFLKRSTEVQMTPTLPINLRPFLSQTPSKPPNLPAGRPRWGRPGMLYQWSDLDTYALKKTLKSIYLEILVTTPSIFFHTSIKQVYIDLVLAPQPHCTTLSLHWVHLLSPPIGVHLLSPPSAPPQGCTTTTTEGANITRANPNITRANPTITRANPSLCMTG